MAGRHHRPGRERGNPLEEPVAPSADHSTPAPARDKPATPYPDFPTARPRSRRLGPEDPRQTPCFGPWDDPDAAPKIDLEQKDAFLAGRKPREATLGFTVKDLVNRSLNAKQTQLDAGEFSPRTCSDYRDACEEAGPHRLGKAIQCVRCAFKRADGAVLIDRPLRNGPGFKKPPRKTFHPGKPGEGRTAPGWCRPAFR